MGHSLMSSLEMASRHASHVYSCSVSSTQNAGLHGTDSPKRMWNQLHSFINLRARFRRGAPARCILSHDGRPAKGNAPNTEQPQSRLWCRPYRLSCVLWRRGRLWWTYDNGLRLISSAKSLIVPGHKATQEHAEALPPRCARCVCRYSWIQRRCPGRLSGVDLQKLPLSVELRRTQMGSWRQMQLRPSLNAHSTDTCLS